MAAIIGFSFSFTFNLFFIKSSLYLNTSIRIRMFYVSKKYKTIIFVNGCFWHKHDCPRFVWPSSHQEYWRPKIQRNVERDKQNIAALHALGWSVITIWECELKRNVRDERLKQLCVEIKGNGTNRTPEPSED